MDAEIVGPVSGQNAVLVRKMIENASHPDVIGPDTVYQTSNLENRALIDEILKTLVVEGSRIAGVENLDEVSRRSKMGSSCLILMEHYSNFDIPALYYMLKKTGRSDIAESIISIAGMKLNEESGFVKAFTEAYTRIVIYPSRSIAKIADPKLLEQEQRRSREINMAATRQMIRQKHRGHLILVFPAGTRYRPGHPETKRGVKEVSSYVRTFDTMVFISIAGNILHIHPSGDMKKDLLARDVIVFNISKPVYCEEFREEARRETPEGTDLKQCVADRVMTELEKLHNEAEQIRLSSASG